MQELFCKATPSIPGAHTQAESLDELQKNIKEVVQLCLQELDPQERLALPEFIGVQQLEVRVLSKSLLVGH